jgi:alpha-D-xyloside xylohydrolase
LLPLAAVAQSTNDINWKQIELRAFGADSVSVTGRFALPAGKSHQLNLAQNDDGKFQLKDDPLAGDVDWRITEPTAVPGGAP